MKRIILIAVSVFVTLCASAQSNRIKFSEEEVRQVYMLPCIEPTVDFRDPNHNNFLDAKESGEVLIVLKNTGGKSDRVEVSVTPVKNYPHIQFPKTRESFSLEAGEERTVSFPISADIRIPNDSLYFTVNITEAQGYDEKARLKLLTNEYPASKLMLRGVQIMDSGIGTRAINNNPDGIVQTGETVWARVSLQNVGAGSTDGICYNIVSGDQNLILLSDSGPTRMITGTMKDMPCGKTEEIEFRFSPNNRFSSDGGNIPITLRIQEGSGFGNLAANLPIKLGVAPEDLTTFDIKPRNSRTSRNSGFVVERDGDDVRDGSTIKNIMMAPAGVPIYKNAVAVVIGAEQNKHSSIDALYAERDTKIFSEYLKKSMGIPEDRIFSLTNEEATCSNFNDLFNPVYGDVSKKVSPGVTDVFVFYSGHGYPGEVRNGKQDAYLFAYDSRKEDIKTTGYSLNRLCNELNSLNAKSVTLIVDACFSGFTRASESQPSQNSTGQKGVAINVDQVIDPWTANANFRVLTSCSSDETSHSSDRSNSGLFTYYLALGLQSEADSNGDGSITLAELYDYVKKNVVSESIKRFNGAQTPCIYGSGDFLIEKYR